LAQECPLAVAALLFWQMRAKSFSAGDLTLCPSAGPTPRECFGGFVSTVSVPSRSAANDAARLRNGGKAIWGRQLPPGNVKRSSVGRGILPGSPPGKAKDVHARLAEYLTLSHASSAPTLLPSSSPCNDMDVVTPRRKRGMVSKVSEVPIQYPLILRPRDRSASRSFLLEPSSPDSNVATVRKLKRTVSAKRVSFADTPAKNSTLNSVAANVVSMPLDDAAVALQKSRKLQASLYELRRVSTAVGIHGAEESAEAGGDESMIHKVLGSLTDTEAQLKELQQQFVLGTVAAAESGGSRHATSVITSRVVAVIEHKALLLHDTERQRETFEVAHARRDEILSALVADPATYTLPADLSNLRKFVAAYTHSPGSPVDANKSDFEAFVTSFKLPHGHSSLCHLRQLKDIAGEWWADACLRQASDGAGHAILKRLFDVAVHTGVDMDHVKLVRAMAILIDRLAERVLEEADKTQQTDAAMDTQGGGILVGLASKKADEIEASIAAAIQDGVPKNDVRLQKTQEIAKTLRERDGMRKRMAGRQKRLEGKGTP